MLILTKILLVLAISAFVSSATWLGLSVHSDSMIRRSRADSDRRDAEYGTDDFTKITEAFARDLRRMDCRFAVLQFLVMMVLLSFAVM